MRAKVLKAASLSSFSPLSLIASHKASARGELAGYWGSSKNWFPHAEFRTKNQIRPYGNNKSDKMGTGKIRKGEIMLAKIAKLGFTALVASAITAGAAFAQETKTVKIGWAPWSDAEFVTKLAAKLIEDNLGQKVELVQTDVAPLYQGVSRGDIDAMMMAWLPETHADYYKRIEDKVDNLGPLYEGAKLGWIVPTYIPESEISSIEDLKKPKIREKIKGEIQGRDPWKALTLLSQEAIETYGLDYKINISSYDAMVITLDRATHTDGWFVATTRSTHGMYAKYKLRNIHDPQETL